LLRDGLINDFPFVDQAATKTPQGNRMHGHLSEDKWKQNEEGIFTQKNEGNHR